MTTITIDGIDYPVDSLSEMAKAEILSLQFCDAEIQRLEAKLAMAKTARIAYANALKIALPHIFSDGSTSSPKGN